VARSSTRILASGAARAAWSTAACQPGGKLEPQAALNVPNAIASVIDRVIPFTEEV
jgi:hypothetical protein